MNIYELTGQFLELQDMLESGEYETDIIADSMESVEYALEAKAEAYAKIIRNFEGDIEKLKAEQKRLGEKRAVLENHVKRMKETLQKAMITTGKKKFKTDLFSFNIAKNGGALPVIVDVDVSELPDGLVKITREPDKKAIAIYLESGGESGLAHFGERGESLRIK